MQYANPDQGDPSITGKPVKFFKTCCFCAQASSYAQVSAGAGRCKTFTLGGLARLITGAVLWTFDPAVLAQARKRIALPLKRSALAGGDHDKQTERLTSSV